MTPANFAETNEACPPQAERERFTVPDDDGE